MTSRTLFLHSQDTKGIVVKSNDSITTLDWFGVEYIYPQRGTLSDDAILSWARKNCQWSQEEHNTLKGSVVRNPFTQEIESYTLRGVNPKVYKKGQARRDDLLTVPTAEGVEVSIAGTVLEISHSCHPAWALLSMSQESKADFLAKNYGLSSELRILIREDVSAPLLAGSSEAVRRMSEEIPHLHKVVTLDEFLKG